MAKILHLDDDPSVGLIVDDALSRAGHTAIGAQDVPDALQALERDRIDLIISEYRAPGLTGLEFLELLEREGYHVPLIMITGGDSIEHAVAATKAGAIDCITKPVRAQQLQLAVEKALEFVRLRRENEWLRREVMEFQNERQVIGDSPAMRRILQTVQMVAPTRASVLLQGESGTGKGLFARAIHVLSNRRAKPFVQLNCAALPEGLIESALFGHERGAFAGALRRVEGAFERANGGTLLLDDISDVRSSLQPGLLRVLQGQEFERVGGRSPLRVDVRVIATTSRNLAAEAAAGNFEQDLYYRLSVVPIEIPPLRERVGDIAPLALRFAVHAGRGLGKEITGIAVETLRLLQEYPWPGNVRELEHATERAVILSRESVLQPYTFESLRCRTRPPLAQQRYRSSQAPPALPRQRGRTPLDSPTEVVLRTLNVEQAERTLIRHALQMTNNNRTRTAELLGISVRTLRNKLNRRGGGRSEVVEDQRQEEPPAGGA
jgi:DNA-binding NtrC family response regulator